MLPIFWVCIGQKLHIIGSLVPFPSWEMKSVENIVAHIECDARPVTLAGGPMSENLS